MSLHKVFQEIDRLLPRYPLKEAALLPTLHLVQRQEGYLSEASIEAVADYLGLPSVRVEKVISFYTMFRRKPVGKYLLQLCTNISCSLLGADSLLEYVQAQLGIQVGGTTPDGLFTLETVECLGSCGTAPVIQINDDYYEDLTTERLQEILDTLREEVQQ